jgi:hypothetical protein
MSIWRLAQAWTCAVLLLPVAVAMGQQDMLQLGPPEPQSLPSAYLQQRLAEVKRHAATAENDWRGQVRAAYCATAARLIESAAAPQTPDRAAILGVMLADGIADLEAMLRSAPEASPLSRPLRVPPTISFNQDTDLLLFVRQALCPLIVVQQAADNQTQWGGVWPGTPAPPTAEQIAALQLKIASLPVPPQVREPMSSAAASLRQASRFPEFLPMLDDSYRDLMLAIDTIEAAETATWVTPEMKQALHDELGRAMEDYRDPLARARVAERLRDLSMVAHTIRDAQEWSRESASAARTSELLAVNVLRVLVNAATPAAQRRATFRWHQRVHQLLRQTHGLVQPTQPALRTAYTQSERDLLAAIDGVTRASVMLADTPSSINAPAVVEPLGTLRVRAEAMVAVSRAKDALDVVDTYRPVPALGVRQRIMRQADAMKDASQRDRAVGEIARFVQQYERYARLPMENELRRGETGSEPRLVAGRSADLVRAIDAARTAWASAWAAGDDARAAADLIEPLHAALTLAARARTTDMSPGWTLAPSMNAWAGWQGDPEAMRVLFIPLEQAVARMIDDAAQNDMASLRQATATRDREHGMAIAILRIASGLDAREASGFAPMLSQVLFSPSDDAYLAQHRANLATLNRCVNEWALADEAQRIVLRQRAGEAVRRMRGELPPLQ